MKLKLIKDKRGDVFQLLVVLILVLVVAIVGLILLTFSTRVNSVFQNMSGFENGTVAGTANNVLVHTAPYTTDYMIFFLFLFANLGVIISAVRTNFSPIVIVLFLVILGFTIATSAGFVNIYRGLADSASIIDVSSQLTLTNVIFSKFTPLIMTIFGGMIMLIMWGKSGSDIQ